MAFFLTQKLLVRPVIALMVESSRVKTDRPQQKRLTVKSINERRYGLVKKIIQRAFRVECQVAKMKKRAPSLMPAEIDLSV
jgi:hypothetical protein